MDYEDIVDYAVEHTGININYAKALKYVKKRRNFIVDYIRNKINSRYFYKTSYTNLVSWQQSYDIPQSDNLGWLLNIKRVEIKYKSTDTYRTLIEWDYRENISDDDLQNNSKSMYELRWWKIFIYPTPTESVIEWLFIEWEENLADITVASTEWQIFGGRTELRAFNQVVADGIISDFYASNRQYDDVNYAENEFQKNLSTMIRTISNRWNEIITDGEPDHLVIYE